MIAQDKLRGTQIRSEHVAVSGLNQPRNSFLRHSFLGEEGCELRLSAKSSPYTLHRLLSGSNPHCPSDALSQPYVVLDLPPSEHADSLIINISYSLTHKPANSSMLITLVV